MCRKYRLIIGLFFYAITGLSIARAQAVYKIYVAVNGSANAAGTEQQPVNNIAKALQIAQNVSGRDVKEIHIIVHGGTYPVGKSLEIVQGKTWNSAVPLSIEAYKNDVVILHGGKIVPNNLIVPVTDQSYLKRFQPEVRNRIRQINLKEAGITNIGKLRPVGFGRPFGPTWMELFINGTAGQIARWPNKGTVAIDSIIDAGSAAADVTVKDRGGVFTYNSTRPSTWKEPQKAWLSGFFMWGYADDAVPVASMDTVKKIIKTTLPTRYGFGSGKPWRAWYAYNIPEEIDVPGEYYVDADKQILYFLPPDTLKTIELSELEAPIIQLAGVNHVEIKNLQFTCSRGVGIYLEKTEHVLINGCTFNNLGMMAVFMGRASDVPDEKIPAAKIDNDFLAFLYNNTTANSYAGHNNGVVNCHIYQTGAGGIYMAGGDRLTLQPGNNFIKNCRIHDFNRIEKTYRPGIYIGGVGNSISNCEIYNTPSMAIYLKGNNHVIEYNNIHHTDLEADDMGALYYGRDPSERGLIVRYNYFHDIGTTNKTMAIYHDDGSCGMTVTGNVFFKAGTVAGFIGGGQDITYTNNIFLNTRYAWHIDKRMANWAKNVIKKDGLFQKRLEAVNYTQPPYATTYPHLNDYLKDDPAIPKRDSLSMNVLVNMDQHFEGDSVLISYYKNNFETVGDPGFENYRMQDFRLKKTSIIWKNLPGFMPIPFEKIGLQPADKIKIYN